MGGVATLAGHARVPPSPYGLPRFPSMLQRVLQVLSLLLVLFLFFVSLELMGDSFKLMGKDFARTLLETWQAGPERDAEAVAWASCFSIAQRKFVRRPIVFSAKAIRTSFRNSSMATISIGAYCAPADECSQARCRKVFRCGRILRPADRSISIAIGKLNNSWTGRSRNWVGTASPTLISAMAPMEA